MDSCGRGRSGARGLGVLGGGNQRGARERGRVQRDHQHSAGGCSPGTAKAGARRHQGQVNLVNVFATVRDKRHGIVDDLKKEDFKILEDGQEQQVAFYQRETELPITLALLIDTSGSMDRVLPAEQDAASRFIKEIMRKKD